MVEQGAGPQNEHGAGPQNEQGDGAQNEQGDGAQGGKTRRSRQDRTWMAGALLLLVALGGFVFWWVIREKRDGYQSAFSIDFLKWIFTVNGIVAIVSGSVAAFAVYVAVYLRNPTWGSSALQPLTLYGAMFSAFVTTSGLASLTGNKAASGTQGEPVASRRPHPDDQAQPQRAP